MLEASVELLGHSEQQDLLRTVTAQTLLFCGAEGVGRKPLARWYAAWLNCQLPAERPCQQCQSCQLLQGGNHPDYREVQPERTTSTGRVSRRPEIRIGQLVPRDGETDSALLNWLERRPQFRRKVAVIDGAHTLNQSAANAFLKTLEEPPSYATIILIAPSPQAVLPTIASRALVVRLSPVADIATAEMPAEHPLRQLGRPGDAYRQGAHAERFAHLNSVIESYLSSLTQGLEPAFEAADGLEKNWYSEGFDVAELLLAALRQRYPRAYAPAVMALERFEEALAAYSAANLAVQVLTLELREQIKQAYS